MARRRHLHQDNSLALQAIEMALIAAHIVKNFDLSLEEDAVLPEPAVDIALKPNTTLRVRFMRR